jgi:hypothetical protein
MGHKLRVAEMETPRYKENRGKFVLLASQQATRFTRGKCK